MEKTVDSSGEFPGRKTESTVVSDQTSEDHFYGQVEKLNESSGLSLVFNFRDTKLDLYCLYKEVIERGGFHQVTKLGKWDDVASASNPISSVLTSASQLQNIYQALLIQYELMDSRNMAEKGSSWQDKTSSGCGASSSFSTGKRRHIDQDSQLDNCPREVASERKARRKKSNAKNLKTDPDAPLKPRSGYSIYLRLEIDRLKKIYGEKANGMNIREMVTNAWRSLSDEEKQPYFEASKIDKERYRKEMGAYNNKQLNDEPKVGPTDDVYHVSLSLDEPKVGPTDDVANNKGPGGPVGVPYDSNNDWAFY
ncbi:high mobility group [Striga asiatica]|uniref:High mobility group n=1 Tax=Striga asiatica TaxID=4170 RepID=A0A5A7QI77_STRAF|nr:high mobility group [Striga asiatica]